MSSLLDHDLGHLCRSGRIQMSGHSDLGIFNNFGASSIFPGCKQMLHQLLVLRILDMISMTFAAVIRDADDPCSVNTA